MSETSTPLLEELHSLQQSSAEIQETLTRALDEQETSFAFQQAVYLAQLHSLGELHEKTVSDLRAQADEQQRVLANRIHHLRAEQNIATPINRLPPEILSSGIFFTLKALLGTGKRGWLNVTYVCQRWRNDALSDATLWTEISGSKLSAEWVATTLERSKTSPLTVAIERVWQAEALSSMQKGFKGCFYTAVTLRPWMPL